MTASEDVGHMCDETEKGILLYNGFVYALPKKVTSIMKLLLQS